MTSKTTMALVAAGLALVALAPLANAAVADDTLSRSFVYVSGARAETAPNAGIGWYDNSNPPNVCILDLLGVQTPIVGVFYYETGRVYTNLPGFVSSTTVPATGVSVPVACPGVVNPLCNAASGCAIRISPTTINPLARTIIPQDGSICTQQSSFISCIATAGVWTTAACNGPSFTARNDDNKGLLSGTGLSSLLLSQDINCASYVRAYDVSFLLGSDGNPIGSGFDGTPASLYVPFNGGAAGGDSGYVVQCLRATYTTIDSSTVPPTVTAGVTEDGVDYELVLDLDAPTGWAAALATHVGTGASGNALQGLYDLGGNNNCDFNAVGVAPPQCANGVDDADADPLADVKDPQCFSSFNGVPYYNPANSE